MSSDTILQKLENNMPTYTAGQRQVADYILKNQTTVAFQTVTEIAEITGVSTATVMRLAYALGFSGFLELQESLQKLLQSRLIPPNKLLSRSKAISKNTLLNKCMEVQINNIQKTTEFLEQGNLDLALELISKAKKIYVIGIRTSTSAANFLNDGFNRIGLDSELLSTDSVRLFSILKDLTTDSLVIAISLPRYATRTTEIATIAKNKGAKLLSITDGYSSPLATISTLFCPAPTTV